MEREVYDSLTTHLWVLPRAHKVPRHMLRLETVFYTPYLYYKLSQSPPKEKKSSQRERICRTTRPRRVSPPKLRSPFLEFRR